MKEFAKDLRVVIRHPWYIGIPIPERLLPKALKEIKDYDAVMIPRGISASTQDPVPGNARISQEINIPIPEDLLHEFGNELRVVIKHPWWVGIPVIDRLRPDILKGLRDVEVILVPKQTAR